MLANLPETSTQAGTLNREVHVKATFLHELIDFVAPHSFHNGGMIETGLLRPQKIL
jgi:hypothetical protein